MNKNYPTENKTKTKRKKIGVIYNIKMTLAQTYTYKYGNSIADFKIEKEVMYCFAAVGSPTRVETP